jgi:acetoin utilization deacetylase AcuC-like enzyme
MLYLSASPELDGHDTGPDHPERKERVLVAIAGLKDAGLGDVTRRLEPRRATEAELERVHTKAYLDSLAEFCAAGGGYLDSDTVVSEGSWDTALLATGGTLAAVDAVAEAGEGVGFACHRPPAHHATAYQAMGFCLLNSVAVAASVLVDRGERVLVLDWDLHHGNGTQAAFWDDPRVLYISTHQHPYYPGTGSAAATGGLHAKGLTINIPLPRGVTGDVIKSAYDRVVTPAVERFAPTWVLISAGFDAHRDDPVGQWALSAGDFADMARWTKQYGLGPRRIVAVLEGGYDFDALRHSVGAAFAELLDRTYRPEPATSGGPGRDEVERAREVQERTAAG